MKDDNIKLTKDAEEVLKLRNENADLKKGIEGLKRDEIEYKA